MKKKRTQPAHKSYFFEQGYKDIGSAIKTSWLKMHRLQKLIMINTMRRD